MIRSLIGALAASILFASAPVALAQSAPDTLVVLDASGSMWGQIDGRTKIEIARETLSTVLSEASPDMNIGLIAYGHRQRGACSDIETLVPMGPARQTVPRMIDVARRINPIGKTPLSDAVRIAAEEMNYTENAATVVLITDGIETCDADPCALGAELERRGIDFTAHVVGFGLTGDEGRQVACLAENTGGRYFPADDADQLVDALRDTLVADESDFVDEEVEPAMPQMRRVEMTFRDAEGMPKLDYNQIEVTIEALTGRFDNWSLWGHTKQFTGDGDFAPGRYVVMITRNVDRQLLKHRFEFDVDVSGETLVIDRAIAARLRVDTWVNSGIRVEHGKGVAAANMSGNAFGVYELVPVVDGAAQKGDIIVFGYRSDLDIAVTPGTYVLRGTFGRSFTREKLIEIAPGEIRTVEFDFELAEVDVDVRDGDGFPVHNPITYLYDVPAGGKPFHSGRDRMKGEKLKWYLPVGIWRLDTGAERGGEKRSQAVAVVSAPTDRVVLRINEGQRLADDDLARLADEDRKGCLGFRGTEHGRNACLIESVDIPGIAD